MRLLLLTLNLMARPLYAFQAARHVYTSHVKKAWNRVPSVSRVVCALSTPATQEDTIFALSTGAETNCNLIMIMILCKGRRRRPYVPASHSFDFKF